MIEATKGDTRKKAFVFSAQKVMRGGEDIDWDDTIIEINGQLSL